MKTYSLEKVIDELLGEIGTVNRDQFESELQNDLKEKHKTNLEA